MTEIVLNKEERNGGAYPDHTVHTGSHRFTIFGATFAGQTPRALWYSFRQLSG